MKSEPFPSSDCATIMPPWPCAMRWRSIWTSPRPTSSVLEITGITVTPDAQYSDLATVTVHYTVHAEGEVELSFGFGGTSIAENRQVTTKQPEEKPTEPTKPAETTPSTEPSEGPGGGPSAPTGGAEPRETTPSASMPSEAAPSEPVEPTAAVDPETIRMYALPDALALQLQGGGQAEAPGAADPVPVTVVTVQPEDDRKLLLLTGAGATCTLPCVGALCALPYFAIGGPQAAFAYWISGLAYDIPHCIGNVVVCLVLFKPVLSILKRTCGEINVCEN